MKRNYVLSGEVCFLEEVLIGVNEILDELKLNNAVVFSGIRIVGEVFVQQIEVFVDEVDENPLIFKQLMVAFCERFSHVMIQSHGDINPFSLPSMVWFSGEGSNAYEEIWHENGIPLSEMDLDEIEESARVICEICSSKVVVPLITLRKGNGFKMNHLTQCPYCDSLMALDIYL